MDTYVSLWTINPNKLLHGCFWSWCFITAAEKQLIHLLLLPNIYPHIYSLNVLSTLTFQVVLRAWWRGGTLPVIPALGRQTQTRTPRVPWLCRKFEINLGYERPSLNLPTFLPKNKIKQSSPQEFCKSNKASLFLREHEVRAEIVMDIQLISRRSHLGAAWHVLCVFTTG